MPDCEANSRLCVLFPGIGYTCDKPLLYFTAALARSLGYITRPVLYGGFPPKVRGDASRLRESYELAQAQAEKLLGDIDWRRYDQPIFVGKSIGTAVAARYASEHELQARFVLLTPLRETFLYPCPDAIAFHGTADPWAETPIIEACCAAQGIPLYLTADANHSLETGDVDRDLDALVNTMRRIRTFLETR